MLHPSHYVSTIAFEGIGSLFLEFSIKKLNGLARVICICSYCVMHFSKKGLEVYVEKL